MTYSDAQLKLFSLNSNPELAEKISKIMDVPLGKVTSKQFSDGEIMINMEESVRNHDVYIIQSTSWPVNDNIWELLIMIDACVRASAHSVNIVMPYFGYARQDRTASSREPITAKLVADMLVKAGADRVLTLDIHAVQVQGFFDIPVDNLFTVPLFAEYYMNKGLSGDDVVVVAPKNSGIKRARSLAEYLEAPIAIVDYEDDDAKRENGYIIGNVEGKNCILIDDMIDTAGTITAGVDMLKQKGAKDVYIACTHGVLSGPAIERLSTCAAKEVVITNTIEIPQEKKFDKLVSVSVAGLLAHTIENIENDLPVSDVFTQYDC